MALARGATSATESRLRLKPHFRCRKLAQQWLGCYAYAHSRKCALRDSSVPQRDLNVVLCCAQAQLLDSLFGTERGLSASSEVRAEINELITQLEAKSPTSDLSEVRFLSLMPLLAKVMIRQKGCCCALEHCSYICM